jgi:hypothetical protein
MNVLRAAGRIREQCPTGSIIDSIFKSAID